MNFLAHLFLARPTDESIVGNLLGDFAKGTIESLKETYPPGVIEGIKQHRAIDLFTDSHPSFQEARELLSPHRRRFAGIIVDIYYDHFLSQQWPGRLPVGEFIANSYTTLERNSSYIPEPLNSALPRMRQENWLGSYSSREGLALTFQRILMRSPKLRGLTAAEEDLFANYNRYEDLFHRFFPELQAFSENWLASSGEL